MNGVINGENINFSYGPEQILHQACLDISSGELVTILGPNGCGKTTLLKCLNRLHKADGTIEINGKDIWNFDPKSLAQQIGYVPQNHQPSFGYSVLDVVVCGRIPYLGLSSPSGDDYIKTKNALELVGIEHFAERPYTNLSGGQLRLVILALALVQETKFLLLDEPTSNLDLKNKVIILKILKKLVKQGLSVAITEHDPILAAGFADRVLLMKQGRIVAYGPPKDVLTAEDLQNIYEIEVDVFQRNSMQVILPIFAGVAE